MVAAARRNLGTISYTRVPSINLNIKEKVSYYEVPVQWQWLLWGLGSGGLPRPPGAIGQFCPRTVVRTLLVHVHVIALCLRICTIHPFLPYGGTAPKFECYTGGKGSKPRLWNIKT